MQSIQYLSLLTTMVLLTACGAIDASEFRTAIPSERSVTVQAPDASGNALRLALTQLGETSEYYQTTRQMTRDVNNGVKSLIGLVEEITAQSPTSEDGDTFTWGPGSDALSPVYYRFQATKTGEGTFTYAFQYRPKDSEDKDSNYQALLEGDSDVSSGINDGVGELVAHIGRWNDIEPGACGSGSITATYDTLADPQFLAVEFDDFHTECETDTDNEPLEAATYYYERYADGSGNFQFSARGDIDNGTLLVGIPEILAFRSRWLATGAGRADVIIYDGDLFVNHGLEQVTANECWDEFFILTYADIAPAGVDVARADLADETACVDEFQEAEYATDIDNNL